MCLSHWYSFGCICTCNTLKGIVCTYVDLVCVISAYSFVMWFKKGFLKELICWYVLQMMDTLSPQPASDMHTVRQKLRDSLTSALEMVVSKQLVKNVLGVVKDTKKDVAEIRSTSKFELSHPDSVLQVRRLLYMLAWIIGYGCAGDGNIWRYLCMLSLLGKGRDAHEVHS